MPENGAGTRLGDDYYTERRGSLGWCVVRVADRVVIHRGHTLESAAINEFYRSQPKAA
jgi:hypothetical protein